MSEYAVGEAEDEFAVLSTSASATLGTGPLVDLVKTEDTTRLDPSLVEHVKGPQERIELATVEKF